MSRGEAILEGTRTEGRAGARADVACLNSGREPVWQARELTQGCGCTDPCEGSQEGSHQDHSRSCVESRLLQTEVPRSTLERVGSVRVTSAPGERSRAAW